MQAYGLLGENHISPPQEEVPSQWDDIDSPASPARCP
jgi:hypothetical protein